MPMCPIMGRNQLHNDGCVRCLCTRTRLVATRHPGVGLCTSTTAVGPAVTAGTHVGPKPIREGLDVTSGRATSKTLNINHKPQTGIFASTGRNVRAVNAPDTGKRAPDDAVRVAVLAHVNGRDLSSERLANVLAAFSLHLKRDGFLPGTLHRCRPGSLRHRVGYQGTVVPGTCADGVLAFL